MYKWYPFGTLTKAANLIQKTWSTHWQLLPWQHCTGESILINTPLLPEAKSAVVLWYKVASLPLLLQLSSWMFLCTTNNAARYCEMSPLFNYSLSTSQSLLDAVQHVLNLIKCSTDFVGTPPGWACTDPHEAVLQYRTLMWELFNSAKGGY